MDEEVMEESCLESDSLIKIGNKFGRKKKEEEKIDVLTEDGKKKYLEEEKKRILERYQNEIRYKTEEDLTNQASKEVAKELGISEEELANPRGRETFRGFRDNKVNFDPVEVENYVNRIKDIQSRQNEIIDNMIDKQTLITMAKNNTRNAVVTEYLHLEVLKARFLDIVTAAYTKRPEHIEIVDEEGQTFTRK